MAAGMEIANRNKAIISAVCKRLGQDPNKLSSESIGASDIMSLFSNILKLSGSEVQNQSEVMKWVEFASNFPSEPEACHAALKGLNEDLAPKTVLLGGLRPSEADIVVLSTLYSFMSHLSEADIRKYPNVIRWMDYIQNKEDFGGSLAKLMVNKPEFEHFCLIQVDKTNVDQTSKKVDKNSSDQTSKKPAQASKDTDKSERIVNSVKGVAEKKTSMDDKPPVESKKNIKSSEDKKQPDKEPSEKDTETSVTLLNIQIGLIRKAWKHPSADSLLVEEIDLGDGNMRQVVSGLAKYCNPEDLTNRRVVLITNVKPGKLRDVMSAGLVLCASSQDHTVVEPLTPPEGAIIGERISFSGYEGKPEDVLNPKKKQLDKITPTHPNTEVKNEKDELKTEANKAEEAWAKTLESFKEEALKMKEMSQEAYEVYSKKAMVVLKKTSETLKIQANKAKEDLNIVVKQISKEGKVYLSTAAEKSPDSIKDVVETFASSTDELKEMSAVRDFHLGIPYGAFLSIGGFLSFMLTGSISAIRFGVILGTVLLALSVASLRAWKNGQSSELLLKGQAAIAAIIVLREWRFFCQRRLFSTLPMTLISGAMLAFYVYRILVEGSSKGPT